MDEEAMNTTKSISKIRQLLLEQNYEEAVAELNTIPEKYRKQKLFRLTEIQVMATQEEALYIKSMEDFQRDFPDDPCLSLVMIDHYFLKKDFNHVLKELDNIQKIYGKDYILDYYRANCYFSMGDYKKAAVLFKKVAEAVPDFADTWESLLTTCLEMKDHSRAVLIADKLIADFGFVKADIQVFASGYPDFVDSKEYRTWSSK